jgi:hypothetical protein
VFLVPFNSLLHSLCVWCFRGTTSLISKPLSTCFALQNTHTHTHTHTHCSSMNVDQTDSAPPPYKHHCVQHIPSHYEVNFLDKIIVCPVPDCPAWTTNNTNIIQCSTNESYTTTCHNNSTTRSSFPVFIGVSGRGSI